MLDFTQEHELPEVFGMVVLGTRIRTDGFVSTFCNTVQVVCIYAVEW